MPLGLLCSDAVIVYLVTAFFSVKIAPNRLLRDELYKVIVLWVKVAF